eukprot:s2532_g28.t1
MGAGRLRKLGHTPTLQQVQGALKRDLREWLVDSRKATWTITGLAKSQHVSMVLAVLKVNVFHITAAMNCARAGGRWQLAQQLLQRCLLQGHTTTATWNCAVAAAGAWPRAELLFTRCSRWSTELDTVSLGSLLSGLPWPKALASLTGSSAHLLTPDTVCWRTTISCCDTWLRNALTCWQGLQDILTD